MQRLKQILQRIDGRGYGAYKDLRGNYQLQDWTLIVDHVQGDPFAVPSRLRLRLPLALAGFPASCLAPQARRGALGDFLTRCFHHAIHRYHGEQRKNNRGAAIRIDQPGQEVLPRSSIAFTDAYLEARFTVCLPARGRTILGRQAMILLGETLPAIADHSLRYGALQHDDLTQHLNIVEDQQT